MESPECCDAHGLTNTLSFSQFQVTYFTNRLYRLIQTRIVKCTQLVLIPCSLPTLIPEGFLIE